MARVSENIEVDVPLQTAYNQWTQFEDFPNFMENVESVTQLDDTHLRWIAEWGGNRHEWEAEIYEQVPDERIAWRSTGGVQQSGIVTFEPLGDRTKVTVEMEWEPESFKQKVGSVVGADERAVSADLERYKEFVEARGVETGAWRGSV
ncbi:MAG: SRPBCC family protein [Thermoleophilia bacterium]|nr:SRPBCC family protein [Thermoleophilia bacterium]